jgi:glycosyltransferase involved in cell wall biosynthesis
MRFMASAGFCITAVSSPGEHLAVFAAEEGVSTRAIRMDRRISPVRDLKSIAKLVVLLRKSRPSIVHSHTPKGGLLGMIGAWIARVPVRIYHMRGLPMIEARGIRRLLLTWSESVGCRLAHRVICVSESLREIAIAKGLVTADRIRVLAHGSGNGVDAATRFNPDLLGSSTRDETRADVGINTDDFVIGFVGRLVRDKGIVELADAWQQIAAAIPNARLLLLGHFEKADPVPVHAQQLLESDSRVHFRGWDWDMPKFYAAMDLLVLPSYREGFPNAPLEAAAMRIPVIATRVAGCVDAVVDGETGSLVPPRDSSALAEAIIAYAGDATRRAREGENGRRRALTLFRPELIWSALRDQYFELLADNRLPSGVAKGSPLSPARHSS